jgi:hypothetical protein
MTAPVVAARTATLVSSNAPYHVVNLGSPSAGDLLIVISAFDGTASSVVFDEGYSGLGWVRTSSVLASGMTARVASKIAQGGGADALRYMTPENDEQSSHICIRITGHGGAVFIASTTGNSTNADPPNGAITGAAQDLLCIAAACFDGTITASGAPAGYGTLTSQAGGAAGASVSVADKASLAATSDNPATFTSSTAPWAAFTVLVPENAITTNARATQVASEAVSIVSPNLRATQVAIEAISSFQNHAVITQVALETLTPQAQNLYATQVALEVLSGDPWMLGNSNKYRQIQIAC